MHHLAHCSSSFPPWRLKVLFWPKRGMTIEDNLSAWYPTLFPDRGNAKHGAMQNHKES
jgi:hypothetical protein